MAIKAVTDYFNSSAFCAFAGSGVDAVMMKPKWRKIMVEYHPFAGYINLLT